MRGIGMSQPDIPDIVIRPAGVWDTRAPLYQFVEHHRRENQIYFALVLGVSKLLLEARQEKPDRVAAEFFNYKNAGRMASRAWTSYTNSFPQVHGARPQPTVKNASESLLDSIPSITEYAIVSYCGVFETYVQCWALNFLLARLESGAAWTRTESRLARSFSPLYGKEIPSLPKVCEGIPIVKETFEKLPHVFVDPTCGKTR
jgi:hypothetical protein